MNKNHRKLYKDIASVVSYANESRPIEDPIVFSNVEEVAYRELKVSNDEEKALSRATEFILAQMGENISYDRDLDLFPDDYLYNIKGVDGKLDWLEETAQVDPRNVSIIASAVDQSLDSFESIHAWTRLEVLKETGQISSDLYNLVEKLEREAYHEG